MSTRLKDIAKETGFSINTVSLALQSSKRISDETRNTIVAAARRLKYTPPIKRQHSEQAGNNLIGLLLPRFGNFIINNVSSAIEKRLFDSGFHLLATTTRPYGEMQALEQLCRQKDVVGVFVFPMIPMDPKLLSFAQDSKIPFVFLSFDSEVELAVDAVYSDCEGSAYLVMKHLIEMGHREIGFVTSMYNSECSQVDLRKYNGVLRAMREVGINYSPSNTVIGSADADYRDGYVAARTLLRRTKVTAIYCTNDPMASGVLSYCIRHGIEVPQQLSIACNDCTSIAQFAAVPITGSLYPTEKVANEAVNLMLSRIKGTNNQPLQRVAFPSELMIGKSTQPIR